MAQVQFIDGALMRPDELSSRAASLPPADLGSPRTRYAGAKGQMAMRRRRSRPRAPADRCVAVAARFAIYRRFGRRPSQVYVDTTLHATASGPAERRLSDNVFWRSFAEVGDQIEDRAGSMSLLTAAKDCHPIQLSAPQPLEVATAFEHAAAVLRADAEVLDSLLAAGIVSEISPQRSNATLSRSPDIVLADDHPLVVTIRPDSFDGVSSAACGSNAGGVVEKPSAPC